MNNKKQNDSNKNKNTLSSNNNNNKDKKKEKLRNHSLQMNGHRRLHNFRNSCFLNIIIHALVEGDKTCKFVDTNLQKTKLQR